MGCTCGEPDEIKKNTHPKCFTALFRDQATADLVTGTDYAVYVDIGQYGISRVEVDPVVRMRDMEDFMLKRRAVPFLYVVESKRRLAKG